MSTDGDSGGEERDSISPAGDTLGGAFESPSVWAPSWFFSGSYLAYR